MVAKLLLLTAASSAACPAPPWKGNKSVDIYTEIWPPYQVRQGNEISGIATEQIRDVLEKTNISYQFLLTPWSRALRSVHQNPNSLIYSISRTPEREQQFYWIHQVGYERTFLVSRSDFNASLNDISEATSHRLVLKRLDATNQYFLDLGFVENKNLFFVNTSKQALEMLSRGRGDFYPITESSFDFHIQAAHFQSSEFKFIYELERFNVELYLAMSRSGNTELASYLSDVFYCEPTAQKKH